MINEITPDDIGCRMVVKFGHGALQEIKVLEVGRIAFKYQRLDGMHKTTSWEDRERCHIVERLHTPRVKRQ